MSFIRGTRWSAWCRSLQYAALGGALSAGRYNTRHWVERLVQTLQYAALGGALGAGRYNTFSSVGDETCGQMDKHAASRDAQCALCAQNRVAGH
jgi:hypothetical protein